MSEPLGIATGVVALVQLTLKATQYLKDVKVGGGDRTRLRDELRSVTCVLEMLHDRVEEQEGSEDDEALKPAALATLIGSDGPLERFKATLEDIVAKLAPQAGFRKQALSFKWPFDKKEVMELLTTMERHKSHFSLVLQNDLLSLAKINQEKVGQISKQLGDLHAARRDDEAENILSWIALTSYRPKQAEVLQTVQPGTGKWFLEAETFLDWVKGSVNMLWCPGIPGAGKTRLASLIVDLLETGYNSPSRSLAYIYCDYNQRESQTPLALVSSLLEQVLRRSASASLPPEVLSLYSSHTQRGTTPTLKQISEVFSQVFSSCEVVHIVIDALDECGLSDDSALEFVSTVRKLGTNVRLLITSRFSTTFETYFENAERMEIAAHDQDIRIYLETQIKHQPRLTKHIRADSTLQEDIVKAITDGSRGMFLLATLHLESLSRKITRRDVRSSLNTLPKTLDATYEQALARIRSQAEEDVELAETVILWILCARRPLSVFELQHMYAIRLLCQEDEELSALEDDDLPPGDIVTGVCGSLIVVDSTSQTVRLVHYTAQDFLLRTHHDGLHGPRLELTKVCLNYLQLPNFSDGPSISDAAMTQRLDAFPFLDYAANYWGSEVDEARFSDFWDHLHRFLSNKVAVDVASQVWSLPQHRHAQWSEEYPRDVPALTVAASFELPTAMDRLVAQNHNVEGSGSDGETPLIRAARLGYAANITALLRLGANIDATDVAGETALERATSAGKPAAVKALLDGGANVNTIHGEVGWTVLLSAVASGNIETVRLLVGAGANLTAQTRWGESALSLATLSGQETIANFLADSGAILPLNQAGRRASLHARKRGLQALVRRLTSLNDPDYSNVADMGLQREAPAVGQQLTQIAEVDEETSAGESDNRHASMSVVLEGLPYRRGLHRRYTLLERLGKGHFSEVYICTSKTTTVRYAVKILTVPSDSVKATSFDSTLARTEVMSMMELKHVNIIGLIETIVSDAMDKLCLVLELCTEGDLFHYIVQKQKISDKMTRHIYRQLFSALDFMHKKGWAHRDIKAENILIRGDLNIKLTDFGLAIKLKDLPNESDDRLCGTPSYVAPEILADSSDRSYSYGVDVWSAGVVLYICLCGFPPFSDELFSEDYPYTLSQQIKSGRFDYPSPYWDSIEDPALDLIDSMIVVDATKRFTIEQSMNHPWMLEPAEDQSQESNPGDGDTLVRDLESVGVDGRTEVDT